MPVPNWKRLQDAQRRPESEPRRHPRTGRGRPPPGSPLNEGRSLNPGDTTEIGATMRRMDTAQRRPESEPRRHRTFAACPSIARSTAQRRPESEPRRHHDVRGIAHFSFRSAQRRPESEPRRHRIARRMSSMTYEDAQRRPESEPRRHRPKPKAGFDALHGGAQRRPESEPRRHPGGGGEGHRSGSVAQRRPESEPRRHLRKMEPSSGIGRALNEGRSLNPGDTSRQTLTYTLRRQRSTKAGV